MLSQSSNDFPEPSDPKGEAKPAPLSLEKTLIREFVEDFHLMAGACFQVRRILKTAQPSLEMEDLISQSVLQAESADTTSIKKVIGDLANCWVRHPSPKLMAFLRESLKKIGSHYTFAKFAKALSYAPKSRG